MGRSARNHVWLGVALLAVAGLAALSWWQLRVLLEDVEADAPAQERGIIAGSSMIGGPFTLIDHTGRTVTDATFRGKYLLVFFGLAQCPDVCPLALDRFAQVLELLGPDGEAVQPLMVSVDPERDTPAVLRDFVTAFHPKIIGLTGSLEQVREAASRYKAFFGKAATDGDGYAVNHSAYEYLMGPDGRNLHVLTPEAQPERVAQRIKGMIKQ